MKNWYFFTYNELIQVNKKKVNNLIEKRIKNTNSQSQKKNSLTYLVHKHLKKL